MSDAAVGSLSIKSTGFPILDFWIRRAASTTETDPIGDKAG